MTDSQQELLASIKKTHENIALTLGTILAMILVVYFLSYSALANSTHISLFWFEMISSIFIVWGLMKIQAIALFFTKLRYQCKADDKEFIQALSLDDLRN
jgi:biotin transporter BioY